MCHQGNEKIKILFLGFFVFCKMNAISQIGIKLNTLENTNQTEFSIVGDNGKSLQLLRATEKYGYLYIDTTGIIKISISHISYFDTTIETIGLRQLNTIVLRTKIKPLDIVMVSNLPILSAGNFKVKKQEKLFFQLIASRTWFFSLNLSPYRPTTLLALYFKIDGLSESDTLLFGIYQNEAAILQETPVATRKITIVKPIKDDTYGIDDFGDLDCQSNDNIFISIEVIRFDNSKSPPRILTGFQEKETVIFIKGNNNIIDKYPMDHYKQYFKAYPQVAYLIKYKKS
jgi:hypothetical protein